MNSRIELADVISATYLQDSMQESIHEYLDEREAVLWNDAELDVEVFREVSALYRVIKCLIAKPGLDPMPDAIKRMFYLKRDIYHHHRSKLEQNVYSSRRYIRPFSL